MLSRYPRLRIQIAYAVVLFLGLLLGWRIAYGNLSGWGVDFNQFYAASHLAGTGNLYNWDALQHEELKNGLVGHTARLPVVAYGVKLVSWLPFDVAHWVWVISSAVRFCPDRVSMAGPQPGGLLPGFSLVLAGSAYAAAGPGHALLAAFLWSGICFAAARAVQSCRHSAGPVLVQISSRRRHPDCSNGAKMLANLVFRSPYLLRLLRRQLSDRRTALARALHGNF